MSRSPHLRRPSQCWIRATTVLVRKGPLRRAKTARPCALRAVLPVWSCDGRLRRDELKRFFAGRTQSQIIPARHLHGIADTTQLRHLLYGKKPHVYRIIYRLSEEQQDVEILHIRHGARQAFTSDDLT